MAVLARLEKSLNTLTCVFLILNSKRKDKRHRIEKVLQQILCKLSRSLKKTHIYYPCLFLICDRILTKNSVEEEGVYAAYRLYSINKASQGNS